MNPRVLQRTASFASQVRCIARAREAREELSATHQRIPPVGGSGMRALQHSLAPLGPADSRSTTPGNPDAGCVGP